MRRMLLPVLLCMVLFASEASARASRVSQIPNGSQGSCITCHVSSSGGPRNAFGVQVESGFLTVAGAAGSVVWGNALATLDADGDGYTNGQELGDPTGAWRAGDPNPTLLTATLPGYASCASMAGTGAVCARCGGSAASRQNCPDPCGDGSAYTLAGEVCDGGDFNGASCATEGFASGTLACNATCDGLDTAGCVAAPVDVCGDGVRTGSEDCDTSDLNGASCVSRGYTAGLLLCADNCTFDEVFCNQCGDGNIGGSEACDGANLGGATCESQGFAGGTLACAGCGLDTSGCTLCGNGVRDLSETCDGGDLGGTSCEMLGFTGGTLACQTGCLFDTSACVGTPVAVCGDGVATSDEACDNSDLNGGSCSSLGFVSGTVSCNSDCTFNTDGCSRCGDGNLDAGEQCDGSVPGGVTCNTEGFVGGTLGCNADCTLDRTACTLCGNGTLDEGEACDGTDFGAASCGSLGLGEGELVCLAGCTIDTTACAPVPTDRCGDGVATGDEACDGSDLLGLTCEVIGFASGDLTCAADCTLNTLGCVAPDTDTEVDAGGDTETTTEDTGTPAKKAKSDEGCSAAGSSAAPWFALLGAVALARRRRVQVGR